MGDKVVFLDLDGTILDVSERLYRVYSDTVRDITGTTVFTKSEYWALKRTGHSDLQIYLSTSNPSLAGLFTRLRLKRLEQTRYLNLDVPFPGILNALGQIKKECRPYLLTLRRSPHKLRKQLVRYELLQFFDEIILAADYGEGPAWEKKSAAIRKFSGSSPITGTIIGDTEADIICGKSLGLRTIAVTSGLYEENLLRCWEPDRVSHSLLDAVMILLDCYYQ